VALTSASARERADLLFDPQTSGGLLFAVAEPDAAAAAGRLTAAGVAVHRVGQVTPKTGHAVVFR
jgi:selenide,water dikinase